jgi:ATP-dependent helicase/nuclease subunit B
MIEIGRNIICGQIDMNPQKGEKSSPCNYCDYKSICRFEAGLGGNAYGYGTQMTKEEAKKEVCGYDNDNNE